MTKLLKAFAKDQSGATAIEYGLLAAGIAVVLVPIIGTIGTSLNNAFTSVSQGLQ